MKKRFLDVNIHLLAGYLVLLFFAGCKVPYDPPVNSSGTHYLVVEGFINSNGVPTNIKLTRTRNITSRNTASYITETGAHVVIEDNQNNEYPLYETGNGNYSAEYNLNTSNKYRLHIITKDQTEYLSDFVPCKESPPIDTIGWKFKDSNIQIFANTHDPANNTTFYRWNYTETWEFHSQYYSTLIYNAATKKVNIRTVPVYVCYDTQNSTNILLGSSAKLKEDVIYQAPLVLIPNHDKRIDVLYSIMVTQYALDSAGYNYWNAMKGNTENVGSIFDSQPNQTTGNIHCVTNSSEQVIGYIGAGSSQHERIFISNLDMPAGWTQRKSCEEKYVTVHPDSLDFYFGGNLYIPYSSDPPFSQAPIGYFAATSTCVDCTLSGSSDKPSFWP